MKSILLPPRIPRRSLSENRVLPGTAENHQVRPETVRSLIGSRPEQFDTRTRSNPVRPPVFPFPWRYPSFDVRCNPWLNRTYDPLWKIRPPSAWEAALPIVQEIVRTRDPEKEVERPPASRAPTHNVYEELQASQKPYSSIVVNKSNPRKIIIKFTWKLRLWKFKHKQCSLKTTYISDFQ